ncbi:MAG: insulinase family protein [Fimbriimonadia bacterium]
MSTNRIERTVLANRLRVLVEPVDYVESVALGLWVGTGSRYESPQEAGISHVLEHMMFKGTKSRTAKQIAEEIEGRGGSLNAFTDREFTCYYARVLSDDLPVAMDVLCDMLVNSLFDPEELARERQVILDEIKRHEDEPDDLVHDLHARACWDGHPLAPPVIGTAESVSAIKREGLVDYIERRYRPNRIVVSVAGNADPADVVRMVEERLGLLSGFAAVSNEQPPDLKPQRQSLARDVEQVHFCYGGRGYGQHDPKKYVAGVLDALLGGSMSSRLFQEIREKRGLAYAIGSYTTCHAEGGLFTVYGGTSLANFPQVLDLIRVELNKVVSEPPPADEVERVKNQIRGNLVLGLESMSSRMSRMARNELYFERVVPLEETIERINAVKPEDLQRAAAECFGEDRMSLTAVGPFGREAQA